MTIKRTLTTCAVTLAALTSAAGVWLAGAGTALAPEPVHLIDPLGTTHGSTGNGYYVNSGSSTSVLNWPGSYTPGSAPTGTPCFPGKRAHGHTVLDDRAARRLRDEQGDRGLRQLPQVPVANKRPAARAVCPAPWRRVALTPFKSLHRDCSAECSARP